MRRGEDQEVRRTWGPVVRYGLVVALLLGAMAASWILSWQRSGATTLPAVTQEHKGETPEIGHAYLADTDGWYRITPHEVVVVSSYDLSLAALPDSLPMELGEWRGKELSLGPEIDEWFDHPSVALQRAYRDDQGNLVWLAVFGSRGAKSFHLFEHTPATCYPLSGWAMLRQDLDTIPLGRGQIYARRGLAQNGANHRLVVLYWYLWDNLQRTPDDGVLSIRVSAPIVESEEAALVLLKQRFIPQLFTDVIPWQRF